MPVVDAKPDTASDSGVVADGITNNTNPNLADAGGAWGIAIANAVAGNGATVPFTVSATDAAGNNASTQASFLFDTLAMTPSLRVDPGTGAARGFAPTPSGT